MRVVWNNTCLVHALLPLGHQLMQFLSQYNPMLSPILWEYSVPRLIEWFWLLIFNCFSSKIESNKNEVVYYMSCSCNEFCYEVVSGHFLSCPDALKIKPWDHFPASLTTLEYKLISMLQNKALWFLHVLPKITHNIVILQLSIDLWFESILDSDNTDTYW